MPLGDLHTGEPAIWNGDLWARAQTMLPERVPKIAASYWGIFFYMSVIPPGPARHVAIFIALSLVCWRRGRQVGQGKRTEPFLACYRSIRSCLCRGVACDLMIARHRLHGPGHSEAAFPNRSACANHCAHPAHGDSIVVPVIYALGILFATDYCAAGSLVSPLWVRVIALEPSQDCCVGLVVVYGAVEQPRSGQTSTLRRLVAAFILFSWHRINSAFSAICVWHASRYGRFRRGALALELYASLRWPWD